MFRYFNINIWRIFFFKYWEDWTWTLKTIQVYFSWNHSNESNWTKKKDFLLSRKEGKIYLVWDDNSCRSKPYPFLTVSKPKKLASSSHLWINRLSFLVNWKAQLKNSLKTNALFYFEKKKKNQRFTFPEKVFFSSIFLHFLLLFLIIKFFNTVIQVIFQFYWKTNLASGDKI